MIYQLFNGGSDPKELLFSLLILLPTMMLALSLHETAHGFVAWKCGDPTAHNLGRLSLNPLRHLDPIGLVCLLLLGYGWAKPVPINTRYFRNPKRGMALSALAGPLSNLLLGILCGLLGGIAFGSGVYLCHVSISALGEILQLIGNALYLSCYINFLYAVFNMIPIPPFDGSRVLFAFLPERQYFGIMRYERQIMLGILIAMMVLSRLGLSPVGAAAEWLTEQVFFPAANGIFRILLS